MADSVVTLFLRFVAREPPPVFANDKTCDPKGSELGCSCDNTALEAVDFFAGGVEGTVVAIDARNNKHDTMVHTPYRTWCGLRLQTNLTVCVNTMTEQN
jgi:hypothetical protein